MPPRGTSRKVGADGGFEIPPATGDYEVRALAERPIRVEGKRDWRVVLRLGPNSIGDSSTEAKSVKCASSAVRETSVRRASALLPALGQVGAPLTMKADALSPTKASRWPGVGAERMGVCSPVWLELPAAPTRRPNRTLPNAPAARWPPASPYPRRVLWVYTVPRKLRA